MSVNTADEDQSVIVHDDELESVISSVNQFDGSMHKAVSVPAKFHSKKHSKSGTYQFSITKPGHHEPGTPSTSYNHVIKPPSKLHRRDASVGNLVPGRYLLQTQSLIQLLDHSSRNGSPVSHSQLNNKKVSFPYTHKMQMKSNDENDDDHSIDLSNDDGDGAEDMRSTTLGDDGPVRSDDSVIIKNDMVIDKQREYAQLMNGGLNIKDTSMDPDDAIIDMNLLAQKAAEEFANLANENDRLFRDYEKLKEEYADVIENKRQLETELHVFKDENQNESYLNDEISALRSAKMKWALEKEQYDAHISELHGKLSRNTSVERIGSGDKRKLLKKTDSGDVMMMQTLNALTKEKNELEEVLILEKDVKREYELELANLRNDLMKSQTERDRLSNDLDKQQKLYINLHESKTAKIERLQKEQMELIGRTRSMSMEEKNEHEIETIQLADMMEEQKKYIAELEQENQHLMKFKIKNDDNMFDQLQQIKTHGFQASMQFDMNNMAGIDGMGSRKDSYSQSNYSVTGDNVAMFALGDAYGYGVGSKGAVFKTIRAEQYNLNDVEEPLSTTQKEDGARGSSDNVVSVEDKKEEQKNATDENAKKNRRVKTVQKQKVNAEIEFFLLTCIAVKQNLSEEFPTKPEVLTADAMQLFKTVQKEGIAMCKFNLWLEMQLRDQYGLPRLEGYRKFFKNFDDKYDVKGKAKKAKEKTKKGLVQGAQFLGKTGKEIGGRVRALSKGMGEDADNTEIVYDSNARNSVIKEGAVAGNDGVVSGGGGTNGSKKEGDNNNETAGTNDVKTGTIGENNNDKTGKNEKGNGNGNNKLDMCGCLVM